MRNPVSKIYFYIILFLFFSMLFFSTDWFLFSAEEFLYKCPPDVKCTTRFFVLKILNEKDYSWMAILFYPLRHEEFGVILENGESVNIGFGFHFLDGTVYCIKEKYKYIFEIIPPQQLNSFKPRISTATHTDLVFPPREWFFK